MSFYPLFTLEKNNIIYGKNLVNILLVRIRREGTAPAAKYQVGLLVSRTLHIPFTIKELKYMKHNFLAIKIVPSIVT